MSDEQNVLPFPTTATEEDPVQEQVDTSPEGLKKLAEKGVPQVLRLVNENRKKGIENLRRRAESLQGALEKLDAWRSRSQSPMMLLKNDRDEIVISLDNELLNIQNALDATLTATEAQDSLLDMLVNDVIGMVQNANAMQNAIMVSNGQSQTLIQLLIDKEIITDDEMRETWNELVLHKQEQFKRAQEEQAAQEALEEPSPIQS